MSIATFDKTLKDLGRRELNLREYEVDNVLPSYIVENYPKFVSMLQEYFHFENEDESPTKLIDELFNTRDITQTDVDLLSYIEDEYLLGQSYFQGFADKRNAAKYANTLYRAKGTKYSITQFFRTFFEIEPDVIYTKQYVFTLNESQIGPDSQRYLTDDKLYQKYAVLIKSELSLSQWKDPYKLFVHPAGMYLGAELQIIGVASFDELQYDPGEQLTPPNEIEGSATLTTDAYAMHTALLDFGDRDDEGNVLKFRVNMGNAQGYPDPSGKSLHDHEDRTLADVDGIYSSMAELLTPDSPTLDDDSYVYADSDDTRDEFDIQRAGSGFDLSSTERIDQEIWTMRPLVNRIDSDNSLLLDSDLSQLAVGDSDSEITLREILDREFNN